MSKCKASTGPEIGLREGSKAILGIVRAHAQLIMNPTAQCACPIHHESHSAEKMPSFLTGIFPKTVGIISSSKPTSVSRRQNNYNAAGGHAFCTRASTEDRLEAPRATRGQVQRELCTHKLHSCRRQPVIGPGTLPPYIPSLLWAVCICVSQGTQTSRAVCNLSGVDTGRYQSARGTFIPCNKESEQAQTTGEQNVKKCHCLMSYAGHQQPYLQRRSLSSVSSLKTGGLERMSFFIAP